MSNQLEDRLFKLEQSIRRARALNRALVLLIVTAFTTAFYRAGDDQTLKARRLELSDANGRVRVVLAGDETPIRVMSAGDATVFKVKSEPDVTDLVLESPDSKSYVRLTASDKARVDVEVIASNTTMWMQMSELAAYVSFLTRTGKDLAEWASLLLCDGQHRLVLGSTESGQSISLSCGHATQGPQLLVTDGEGATRDVLSSKPPKDSGQGEERHR